MFHSGATNLSDVDRVGCVVRYCPWWLNANGALTSNRLTMRPVPRATYDLLDPAAQPLFRHLVVRIQIPTPSETNPCVYVSRARGLGQGGLEDEMALEKQLWTQRAIFHRNHKAGLSTAPRNNDHLTEYVEHAERVLEEMRRESPPGALFRLPKL